MDVVTMWKGPALVGTLIGSLGALVRSLARASGRLWRVHEESCPPVASGIQALSTLCSAAPERSHAQRGVEQVPQPIQVVRAPVERVPRVAREAVAGECWAPTEGSATCDDSELVQMDIAREVRRLAALSTPQEEIACRVGIALAEVQLLIAMQAARMSRQGSR